MTAHFSLSKLCVYFWTDAFLCLTLEEENSLKNEKGNVSIKS